MGDFWKLDYDTAKHLKRIVKFVDDPNLETMTRENRDEQLAGLPPISMFSERKPKLCVQSYAPNFSIFSPNFHILKIKDCYW